MRATFMRTLVEIAERDDRVMLLSGDLGFSIVEGFAERFPDRFLNVGVAEQNMVGVATGLAEAGYVPFVYSIVTFASLRPYEFIRNGPIRHQLPFRLVGVGGGFEYGDAGPTHHGVEDVAVMRAQPGMTVIAPADYRQAESALRATWDLPGPVYYRLGKDDRYEVIGLNGRFELGRIQRVRDGSGLLLVAMGSVTREVMAGAEVLATRGVDPSVLVVASVNPPPVETLAEVLEAHGLVVTVEAHSVVGGVGSLVAEVVAERGIGCRLIRCGVRRPLDGVGGSERYLLDQHGLTGEALVDTVTEALTEVGR